jgi:hypothetical protein
VVAKAVKQALWLKSSGHLEEAKELLARTAELKPDSELLALARADIYLAEKNPFWALRALSEYISAHPHACRARAFAARVQITQANLDEARELLAEKGCEPDEADAVRILLLRAEIAELRNQPAQARAFVKQAEALSSRYAEDDDRLAKLERAYDPYRLPLWTFRLNAGAGYASTGMGHAPLEFIAPTQTKSLAVGSLQADARFVIPYRAAFRPTAEFEYSSVEPLTNTPHDMSLRQPTLRVGALLGRGSHPISLDYSYEFIDFDGVLASNLRDGWFASAHRGVYQWELGAGLYVTGSVGYRSFFDTRMSRLESEQGLFKTFALSDNLRVGAGALFRAFHANHRAFDQVGATGLLGLTVIAPKGFELTENLALAYDRFPASQGYYLPHQNDRRDVLLRIGLTLLSPEWSYTKLGLTYAYVSRESNLDRIDFADHRALLELRFRISHDEWRASRIAPEGRVPMRHETELPEVVTEAEQSVRERLRQDEELRRGSSCLK